MMKFLIKYDDIIEQYKNGEFGNTHLSLYDILSKAGEKYLLDKMNLSEIQTLAISSSGFLRHLFSVSANKKKKTIEKMEYLENELLTLGVKNLYNSDGVSDKELAKDLNLEVVYCDSNSMPKDVEATLSPPEKETYLGTIKVLQNANTSTFSYMHEIIHYLRDVGKGNVVSNTYTRKKQGRTDSIDEQDINYLTAAAIMPFEQISKCLSKYENMNDEEEKVYVEKMAKKYNQTPDAVERRIIEVRDLTDYKHAMAIESI